MKIDHICFYVHNAELSRNWFVQCLGFQSIASGRNKHSQLEIVNAGSIYFVLCSPLTAASPIAQYLQRHPSGVSDVAFCVADIEDTIAQAVQRGATLLQPITVELQAAGRLKWARLATCGDLTHTFVERSYVTSLLPLSCVPPEANYTADLAALRFQSQCSSPFTRIDHIVLNVPKGKLEQAVTWYETVLEFQPQQQFAIQTTYSALRSQVMQHPLGQVQLPINEPASPTSQIQEFLDLNQGPGVQHIALETENLVATIAHFRQNGLPLLQVPATYYTQLQQRAGLPLSESALKAVEAQQILVDWRDDLDRAALLQTFTEPVFEQPTFFFELIQRQVREVNGQARRAQGFGEGNFRALFEAIEREQMRRGSLTPIGTISPE